MIHVCYNMISVSKHISDVYRDMYHVYIHMINVFSSMLHVCDNMTGVDHHITNVLINTTPVHGDMIRVPTSRGDSCGLTARDLRRTI